MDTQDAQQDNGASLKLYLRYARRTLKYPGTILVCVALLTSLGAARHFLSKHLYESSTVILLQSQKISEDYVKATFHEKPEHYINTLSQQVLSRSRLEKVIAEMDLYPDRRSKSTMDEVVEHMRGNIRIDVYEESFRLTYYGEDPKAAQAVCSRLADVFISENVNTRTKNAEENMLFMRQQAKEKRENLDRIEEEIRKFKEAHLGELPSQEQSINQTLTNLTARLESISEDIRSARNRRVVLAAEAREVTYVGGAGAEKGVEKPNGPRPGEAERQHLRELEGKLRTLSSDKTDAHPDVVRLKNEIAETRRKLDAIPKEAPPQEVKRDDGPKAVVKPNLRAQAELEVIDREIAELEQEKVRVKAQIEEINQSQSKVPKVALDLQKMEREQDNLQENYNDLMGRMEEAERAFKLEKQNQGEQFKVLDAANFPERSSGLGLVNLLVAGFGAGLGLGFGLALLRVITDPKIYDPEDLTRYAKLDLLVVIPKIAPPRPAPSGVASKVGGA